MPANDLESVRPGYVPAAFTLRSAATGDTGHGFPNVDRQVTLEYVNGGNFIWPLFVVVADEPDQTLFGTEEMAGAPTGLGVSDVEATYHDGIWAAGRGPSERSAGSVVLHWQSGGCHSLTVRTKTRTLAVRGSETSGVDLDQLIRIARSLPLE